MRISKISLCLAMWVVNLALVPIAWAQREIQQIPPLVTYDGSNPDLVHPFVDPLAFDPDFQFFAPAEIGDYGGRPEPATGWFGEYVRMYLWVSRPEFQTSHTEGDFGWGNRYDFGYMSDEGHGWSFSHMHLGGPYAFDAQIVERINRFEPDDELNGPVIDGDLDPLFPAQDRNNAETQQRDYVLRQSLNAGNMVGFEVNKTFRVKPLHYGSIIEPFFGFRYNKFRDYFQRERYDRFDEATGGIVAPFPILADYNDATVEQLTTTQASWVNDMFGGQIGMRWFTQKSRWNLSTDVRFFALQNFQNFYTQTMQERTYYGGVGTDEDVIGILTTRVTNGGHSGEFVMGSEIRAESAFQVTRDFRLQGGFQFLYYGRGVARGGSLAQNEQDLVMAGATFGFEVNR